MGGIAGSASGGLIIALDTLGETYAQQAAAVGIDLSGANVRIRLTRTFPGANRRLRSTSTMAIITPSSRLTTATAVTIVDAVLAKAGIINAPSSTKNADKARDPEMHQTKKGNRWYFGMKAHFRVDRPAPSGHAAAAAPGRGGMDARPSSGRSGRQLWDPAGPHLLDGGIVLVRIGQSIEHAALAALHLLQPVPLGDGAIE
jgi:hypothetical protein